MSDNDLIDDEARARIVGAPEASLVVVAGAGSGKTSSLVGRVAALISHQVDPSRIAVITFTEKAARELLHRLRVDEHVSGIDRAYVGTIHGFCRRILRQHPIEAGLPPMFSVNDEITSSARALQRQTELQRELLNAASIDDELREALAAMAELGKLRAIPALVAVLDAAWDQFEGIDWRIPDDDIFRQVVNDALDPVYQIVTGEWFRAATTNDRLVEVLRQDVVPLLGRIREMSLTELIRVSQKSVSLGGGGTAAGWVANTGHTPKEARTAVKAALEMAGALGRDRVLRQVLQTLAPMVVASAHQRLADGHVTFDDLLVLARRLVHDNQEVRGELQRNLDHILVDEFQDTDPVQHDIIELLCDRSAPNAPIRFAVGDPKQAIYAFRGADVELFNRLAESAQQDGSLVHLRANYRTRADVTQWINATLRARFSSFGADAQCSYEDLCSTRKAEVADLGAAITFIGTTVEGESVIRENATQSALQESSDIAALMCTIVDSWSVGPTTDGGALQSARYQDIAILVRTRGGLPILEHSLSLAGIPYRIEGGSLVYESREVYELLRVLRAVDDPANAAKVVAALRTTVLGVSDLDLFHYRHGQPGGRLRNWRLPWKPTFDDGGHGGARRVFEALQLLRTISDRKHTRSPAQILAALYDAQLGAAVAQFEGPGMQTGTWRRVRFVIDEARQWADATGGTLREYLEWVDARILSTDRSEIATDEGEDSVRILTIHAAKGLQFPIVILAGLGRGDNNDAASVRANLDHNGNPEVRMGILRTLKLTDVDKDRALAEEARLLYVAMTRAQDHLVVSMHQSQRTHASMAKRLQPSLSLHEVSFREPEVLGESKPALADLSWLTEEHSTDEPLPEPLRPDQAAKLIWTPSALPRMLSTHGGEAAVLLSESSSSDDLDVDDPNEFAAPVGMPVSLAEGDPGKQKDPSSSMQPERSSGRYGTTVGIAVHHVLQLVDLDRPEADLERYVAAACDAADVQPQFRHDVEQLSRSIIGSELFAEMCHSTSRQREMYVGTTLGSGTDAITLWGYVDAVFVDIDDRLVIVDFKTDTAMADDDELLARYRHQLAGYAIALQQATGMTIREANLLIGHRSGAPARRIVADSANLTAAATTIRDVLTIA